MKLSINETDRGFSIGWYDSVDGDFGLMLSDRDEDETDLETIAAVKAISAMKTKPLYDSQVGQWVWDSARQAGAALRVAKEAIKLAQSKKFKPMPPWAVAALAEGWKPPKGWKP